jgi:hypothetical protein
MLFPNFDENEDFDPYMEFCLTQLPDYVGSAVF